MRSTSNGRSRRVWTATSCRDGWWIRATGVDGLMVHRHDGVAVTPFIRDHAWTPAVPYGVDFGLALLQAGRPVAARSLPGHIDIEPAHPMLALQLCALFVSSHAHEAGEDQVARLLELTPDLRWTLRWSIETGRLRGLSPRACFLACSARGLDVAEGVAEAIAAFGGRTGASSQLEQAAALWPASPQKMRSLHSALRENPSRLSTFEADLLGLPFPTRRRCCLSFPLE